MKREITHINLVGGSSAVPKKSRKAKSIRGSRKKRGSGAGTVRTRDTAKSSR